MSVIKQQFVTVSGSAQSLDKVVLYSDAFSNFYIDGPPKSAEKLPRAVSPGEANPYAAVKSKLAALVETTERSLEASNDLLLATEPGSAIPKKKKEKKRVAAKRSDHRAGGQTNLAVSGHRSLVSQTKHFKSLDLELSKLEDFRFIDVHFGSVPGSAGKDLEDLLAATTDLLWIETAREEEKIWGVYFTLNGDERKAKEQFDQLGFKEIRYVRRAVGNPVQMEHYLDKKRERLRVLNQECDAIKGRIEEDRRIIEQLRHLKNLSIELSKLFEFHSIKVRFGCLPADSYERLDHYLTSMQNVIFMPSSVETDAVWGIYFTLKDKAQEMDALFASLNFQRVRISERAGGKPADSIAAIQAEMEQYRMQLAQVTDRLAGFAAQLSKEFNDCTAYLDEMAVFFDDKKKAVLSDGEFHLYGWLPSDQLNAFRDYLSFFEDVELTGEDPTDQTGDPPVRLKNPKLFAPFEHFVEMYGMPSYHELDPTALVAITYTLFFGMMFGDVGQGLTLVLAGFLIWRWKGFWLGRIISTVGVSSAMFGVIYGSVFGSETVIPALFKPSENINTVLFAAVGVGVFMIAFCAVLNMINAVRAKHAGEAFFSPNGIAGMLFYFSVLALALSAFGVLSIPLPTGLLFAVIVVTLMLLLLREPLSALVEGKKDWMPHKVGEFLIVSFFELFEVALSFVTNTISFIRIGAFALSHAGMMLVVYLLAQTAGQTHNPIILVLGNLVVIGLEGLIVGIQILRLEFYELFSRFYTGGGRQVKRRQ